MKLRSPLLLSIIVAAACTPSTFDGVSGGDANTKGVRPHISNVEAKDLPAPRQLSPLSVSYVNTWRPKFRWERTPGLTGAIIELSRTRDFAKIDHSYVGTGTELTTSEDLEPGVWFWRLRGRVVEEGNDKGAVEGANASPPFELVVRGNAPEGASDAPNGGIIDFNGDGLPDVSITIIMNTSKDAPPEVPPTFPSHHVIYGQASGNYELFSSDEKTFTYIDVGKPNPSIAVGTDMDGDGISDIVIGDVWTETQGPSPGTFGELYVCHGKFPSGVDYDKEAAQISATVPAPSFKVMPNVHSAGDVNGDGYGDVLVSLPDSTFAGLGGKHGVRTLAVLERKDPAKALNIVVGGADFDGDGFSDVAMAWSEPIAPLRYARGNSDRILAPHTLKFNGVAATTTATAFTTGDFDGDGTVELAFVTTMDAKPAVCVVKDDAIGVTSCWVGAAAEAGFGQQLASGDVDGDGRDDILVASTSGLMFLTHQGKGFGEQTGFTKNDVALPPNVTGFAPLVTVIYPGHRSKDPNQTKPAHWATVSADSKKLVFYNGKAVGQTIDITNDSYYNAFGATLR